LRKTIYFSKYYHYRILLFPIAAMCRSTWREENKIYVLPRTYIRPWFYIVLSLINLDLITIFSTLFLNKIYLTIIIFVLLFPIAAIYRSTRRKEVIIYDLLSFDFIYILGFECYLYENLELIIIFCTLLQKKINLKRYILANIIIVLLFFSQSRRFADLKIAAIERRRIMGSWFG
jgi:hypothetical protein